MATQNLLRLLLLLMLVMRIVLATVSCRFEAEVCYLQLKILLDCLMRTTSHLKRAFTCLVSELVSNPIGYFGKMTSTLGSVVPLAMFLKTHMSSAAGLDGERSAGGVVWCQFINTRNPQTSIWASQGWVVPSSLRRHISRCKIMIEL